MSTAGDLRGLAGRLLEAAGVPEGRAARTAGILVLADAWGIASHGLMRLPHYLERLAAGGCRADADLTPVSDAGAVLVHDGNAGLGHWQLWDAAELARDRCASTGIAAVAVRNSSHCGALGSYVYPALDAGLATVVFSNGPAAMPPWGGDRAVLSTSPLAAGLPSTPRPVVIDLATSAVARGKIAWHAQQDRPLPEGWAFDSAGAPTTDPHAALRGMLAPLGGGKGYALAMLVEGLTGGLVGPLLSADVPDMFDRADDAKPQGISHLVITLRPDAFGDGAGDRLAALTGHVDDAGGRIPGAARARPAEIHDDTAVDLAPATWDGLRAWTERLGVR
ncbi:Ldh family oxidoreductase [Actinophytocola gossypii]|uniref:Ldh family oxidoreductase n=1 Tax=Actinophytocola gossypii TaxID=2812003 RepID=A0ABT2J2E1_9PSEU|nr:Ldh family oxidoreductase [Actinophytocola gossypii]MCT2582021.1 Ldh family oxidoreductase [Actinophytocola gossypii]